MYLRLMKITTWNWTSSFLSSIPTCLVPTIAESRLATASRWGHFQLAVYRLMLMLVQAHMNFPLSNVVLFGTRQIEHEYILKGEIQFILKRKKKTCHNLITNSHQLLLQQMRFWMRSPSNMLEESLRMDQWMLACSPDAKIQPAL